MKKYLNLEEYAREHRKITGKKLSRTDMAEELGIVRTTIQNWERKPLPFIVEVLAKMSATTGRPINDFLSDLPREL